MDKKEAKKLCEAHMYRYVEVKMADGSHHDGIVEHVDGHWLCLAVPGAVDYPSRGFVPGPFYPPGFVPYGGFVPPPGGYAYGPVYPYPRRFSRLVIPLAAIVAISLLPYYW